MKVKVNNKQIAYARDTIQKINFGTRGDGTKKFNNGNKEEQFVGILGEIVTCEYLGFQKIFDENNGCGDKGIDLVIYGQKIDIKTMGRKCDVKDYFINNVHGDQIGAYYLNNIYLFTSLNKVNMELTICGWVTKDEFFERANFYPQGTVRKNPAKSFKVTSKKGLYEIQNSKLNSFTSIDSFFSDMLSVKKSMTRHYLAETASC